MVKLEEPFLGCSFGLADGLFVLPVYSRCISDSVISNGSAMLVCVVVVAGMVSTVGDGYEENLF